MVFVQATILGGLPVIAEVWYSGPDFDGEYDAGVDGLYWQKRDGTRGAPLSEAVMARVEKNAYWQAYVTEQADDWLGQNCPTRYRNPAYLRFLRGPDAEPEYIEEGSYSELYHKLNPNGAA